MRDQSQPSEVGALRGSDCRCSRRPCNVPWHAGINFIKQRQQLLGCLPPPRQHLVCVGERKCRSFSFTSAGPAKLCSTLTMA